MFVFHIIFMVENSREIFKQRTQIALINLTTPYFHRAEEPFGFRKSHQLFTNTTQRLFLAGERCTTKRIY